MDEALLIVRLILGLGLFAHGTQKLFGWFGGPGLAGAGGFFEVLGFRPGRLFALAASLGEAVSGVLVVLGLLGPIGPALAILVMIVAVGAVHIKKGFFIANGGWELNAFYVAAALALAFAGFGAYSLDHVFGLSLFPTIAQTWIVIGIGVVLALISLLFRRSAPAAASPTP